MEEENDPQETWDEPVKAWDKSEVGEKADADEEEKKTFNSSYEIVVDYSEYSTIQGFIYIFFSYQTLFGKIFWIIVILSMLALGLYWCIQAYLDWQNKPVLTTITTTAFSVKQVDFPAVTICSPGVNEDILDAAFLRLFFIFLGTNGVNMTLTPLVAGALLNKPTSQLTVQESAQVDSLNALFNGPLYSKFLNTSFPGLFPYDDISGLMKLMTSSNPDSDISAWAAFSGGYNPCDTSSSYGDTTASTTTVAACNNGFYQDSTNGMCYTLLSTETYRDDAQSLCSDLDSDLLTFESDAQVTGLVTLLGSGKMGTPTKNFFIDAQRDENFDFALGPNTISGSFNNLKLPTNDDGSQYCLTAKYTNTSGVDTLQLSQDDCHANFAVICRAVQNTNTSCTGTSTFTKSNTLDLLLDPKLQTSKKKATSQLKKVYKDMFKRLDQTNSFVGVFSNLWYASLPCFDTKGITAYKDGQKSVLKYCEWKGTQIPCAAMFTKFPTDQGMCCSFNIRRAEEIFQGQTYSKLVSQLQVVDKNASFADSTLPKKYMRNKEPTTLPGRNKGLVLMLDAHTDILAAGSVASDYKGFTGLVSPSGSFPFTMQEGFEIRPGHNNIIALTGSKIDADDSLKDLPFNQRKCLFADENSNMTIHKNFTYSNCIFECALLYAKQKVQEKNNATYACIPWYFPSADSAITVCDPWESVQFFNFMFNDIPDDTCNNCLPDCSTTIYETSITAIPFRRCDSSNVGVSSFCSLDDTDLPTPTKFGRQVINEYTKNPIPQFVKNIESSERTYASTLSNGDIFTQNQKTYDAYDEDIAVVQIYFKKSTVFQMGSQPRMTWIDYFSTVGGLMGLVLGMGIVSIIELVWLCLRLGSRKLALTKWII